MKAKSGPSQPTRHDQDSKQEFKTNLMWGYHGGNRLLAVFKVLGNYKTTTQNNVRNIQREFPY